MSSQKLFLIALTATLFLTPTFLIHSSYAQPSNEATLATTAIDNAEKTLVSAYKTVRDAAEIGADISTLLDQLNRAGEHLVQARISFQQGNFDNSTEEATLCHNIGEEVLNEAGELKNKTLLETSQRLGLTLFASSLAIVFVLFFGFFFWRVLERRFYKQLLQMKPEVADNENDD